MNNGERGNVSPNNEDSEDSEVLVGKKLRNCPEWTRDYVSGEDLGLSDDESNIALIVSSDPLSFEEAVKNTSWRLAMDNEIKSIEKNKTWTLVTLPVGAKKVEVKWIYKIK